MNRAPNRVVSVGAGTAVRLLAFVALACAMRDARSVQAATIYVRTAGSDANDGTSPTSALRTIRRAATLAKPGDHVAVGPGTYTEGNITPAAFARVAFVADRRGTEVGEPPGEVVVDATNFSSGFEFNDNLRMSVDGFVIYGAVNGIYVKTRSDQAVISNNIVSNNGNNGVYVQDSPGTLVFNNLVYNNGGTGILATGSSYGSPAVRVINNTVYKNGNRGIFFAGITYGSPEGLVLNNIVQGTTIAGIQVNATSRDGYVSAGNVSPDGFARGTPMDATDIGRDPLLVNPAGPDGILGGPGYADDDFHLSQLAAGQSATSPAVNAGSDFARRLGLGRGSTRTDGRPDAGWIDVGFHYNNFSAPPPRPEARLRYQPLYVSASRGADENDGARAATPLLTVTRALQKAQPGNRIVLLGGTYREGQLQPSSSGKPGRAIVIQGTDGAVLDAGGADNGVLLSGRSDISLVGLEITGASDAGIEVRTGSEHIIVRRCRLHRNGRRGVFVTDGSEVSIEAALIENNGGRGVQVDGSNVEITRSALSTNVEHGLWAHGSSTVSVSNSQFADNRESGVLVDKSTVTIADSTISGGAEGGARFLNGSTGKLTRVAVRNSADAGVQGISSSVNVSGGSIEGNVRLGIESFLDSTPGATSQLGVAGTRICNNQGVGIRTQDTGATLADVTLCNNAGDGLRQSGGTVQIVRATVTDNHGEGISITGADQFVLQEGQIARNAENGVQVDTRTGSISATVVQANKGNGVWVLNGSAMSISGTKITDNLNAGLVVDQSDVTFSDGTISGSSQEGWRQLGGTAQITKATVTGNQSKGLAVNNTDQFIVSNAHVDNNGDKGILAIASKVVSVSGSMVFANADAGIAILDSPAPQLWNNLVYGNRSSGILVSADQTGSPDAQVLNNTIYGNANRGLLIGGSDEKPPSAGATVRRNIFQGNGSAGVQVSDSSLDGYIGDYNLNLDRYGGLTPPGRHDILDDPQLVQPAAGDFHLSQRTAGQSATSPAVDAGGVDVTTAALQGTTTRTDGVADTGLVDLGYHYGP